VLSDVLQGNENAKVCVVGGGSIGSLHIELHGKNVGTRHVGVVELDPELRRTYSALGFRTYESLKDAFRAGYEIYDICLPTFLHIKAIEEILIGTSAKIICEKPLVLNLDELRRVYEKYDGVKDRLVGAYVERFNEPFIRAQKWATTHSGPYTMSFVRRTKKPLRQDWVKDASKGGSLLLDLGIHDIDASLWLAGARFKEVISRTTSFDKELLEVRLSDNSIVRYEAAWDIEQESSVGVLNTFSIEVQGERFEYDSSVEEVRVDNKTKSVTPRFPSAYILELTQALELPTAIDSRYPTYDQLLGVYTLLDTLNDRKGGV